MARLVCVHATEALDVVDQDRAEVTGVGLGVFEEVQERLAAVGRGPRDSVVGVEAEDLEAVLGSVPLDGDLLVPERLLLPIGRPSQVAYGGLQGGACSGDLVQQRLYLIWPWTLPWVREQHPMDCARLWEESRPCRERPSAQRRPTSGREGGMLGPSLKGTRGPHARSTLQNSMYRCPDPAAQVERLLAS